MGIARNLKVGLKTCLAASVGPDYTELAYLENLEDNSFTQGHDKRYGIRPGSAPENVEASNFGYITYTQTFEFVLTKGFGQDGVSDDAAYDAWLDLHEKALQFNNKTVLNKAGRADIVVNVLNFSLDAPEFLEDKVAVLTGSIDIIYRVLIKEKL